jgi:hypothetical protein
VDTPIVADEVDVVPGAPVVRGADEVVLEVLPTRGAVDVVCALVDRPEAPLGAVGGDMMISD